MPLRCACVCCWLGGGGRSSITSTKFRGKIPIKTPCCPRAQSCPMYSFSWITSPSENDSSSLCSPSKSNLATHRGPLRRTQHFKHQVSSGEFVKASAKIFMILKNNLPDFCRWWLRFPFREGFWWIWLYRKLNFYLTIIYISKLQALLLPKRWSMLSKSFNSWNLPGLWHDWWERNQKIPYKCLCTSHCPPAPPWSQRLLLSDQALLDPLCEENTHQLCTGIKSNPNLHKTSKWFEYISVTLIWIVCRQPVSTVFKMNMH